MKIFDLFGISWIMTEGFSLIMTRLTTLTELKFSINPVRLVRLVSNVWHPKRDHSNREEKQSMYKYTKYEQETIFLYNQEEKTAEIYTYNQSLMRKLGKGCLLYPDLFKLKCEGYGAKTFIIPKKYISVRTPSKQSPEQTQRHEEHMRRMQSMAKTAFNQREYGKANEEGIQTDLKDSK